MLWHCLFSKTQIRYRVLTYGKQQLLWQKQAKVIGSIDLDSQIDEYHTGVAQFRHVVCHCRSLLRQSFAPMSLFFVAADAYGRSFSEFFTVGNVNSVLSETNKDNIIQQLFRAEESCMGICFNQLSSRRLFQHFKPRSGWSNNEFVAGLAGLVPAHLPPGLLLLCFPSMPF